MKVPLQLVFDANILVDALLARGRYYQHTVALLDKVAVGEIEGWYAPHTITIIYYLVEKTLALETKSRAEADSSARALIKELVQIIKPLPQVGDEVLRLSGHPGDSYEDDVICVLAKDYLPNPLIVTRDKWFTKRDDIHAAHPKEIIELDFKPWLQGNLKAEFIDLATQQRALRPEIQRNIHRVLHHGQYIMGPEVKQLEEKLTAYTGSKHCITVASGTEALLISLMALGIKPGDEIITTPFTFIATAEVIVLLGAKPVFVDIEPETCNIDANKIEAAITLNTKAIMPVSLYGQPADMDEINAIAAKHGLPVIEDAAQSFGAEYKGKKSGNLSTIGCTSFFPSKPLGCYGDGGTIFTNDDVIAQACREIRVHGQSKRYVHTRVGVGGRMDTLQCAIVLAKLERFDWEIHQRLHNGARYNKLMDEHNIARVQQRADRTSVFAQYTVLLNNREQIQEKFKEAGIPIAVHYPFPLNQQPAYQHLGDKGNTPISNEIAKRVMSLPMGADLSESNQHRIAEIVASNKAISR